jgi:hypothetical protein
MNFRGMRAAGDLFLLKFAFHVELDAAHEKRMRLHRVQVAATLAQLQA